jgi:hypothetical protein
MIKQNIKEGSLFSVPIDEEKQVLGIVVRLWKPLFLAYYFKYNKEIPTHDIMLNKEKLLYVAVCSTKGFDSDWKVLGSYSLYERSNWGLPLFYFIDPLTDRIYAREYDDNYEPISKRRAIETIESNMWPDVVFGHKALEARLKRFLNED